MPNPTPARTNRPLTVVGLVLALAMGALEATVIATAMPTVVGELGGIHHYSWVTNAYLLSSAVTVPIYGKLADAFGRKPIILFGILVFLLGSVASGASHTMTALIAFRALQGLGAGAMQPMALTIVGDIFDLEERSRMQGIFGGAWGLFGLIGPMLGGLIVKHLSWRWVFYVNVPFGVAAAVLIATQLHENIEVKPRKLDFLGAATLAGGVTALLVAANRVTLGTTIVSGALGLALVAAFLFIERRAPEPLMPLHLFGRPVMRIASFISGILGGAMIATLTYVPLYVQGVLHGTPTQAGSTITPMVIGWPIASAVSGRLVPKVGFRPLIRIGTTIAACAAALLAILPVYGVGGNGLRLATFLCGVGMGLSNTALLIAVQTSVGWDERGIATASTMFFRTMGGTLAIGAMGGILNAALLGDPAIPPEAASHALRRGGLEELPAAVLAHLDTALRSGLGGVFLLVALMAGAAFLAGLRFPKGVSTAPAGPPNAVEVSALSTGETGPMES